MRMRNTVVAAVGVVLLSTGAWASIPAPSSMGFQDNGQMTWATVSLSEASCDVDCSASFDVQLQRGYSAASAVVFMNLYYLRFPDSTADEINHAKLIVKRNTYNPTTGILNFTVFADLEGQTTNRTFEFGVWFTALAGDGTNVLAKQLAATNYSGAGAGGTCDSSAACTDSTTWTGVGLTNVPFASALIRGFDVSTASGNYIKISGLGFDFTGYSGATSASGSSTCRFLGSPSGGGYEDLNCEVDFSTLAFQTNTGVHVSPTSFTDSTTGATGDVFQSAYGYCATTPSSVYAFVLGLRATDQTPSTAIKFGGTITGTGATALDGGTSASINTQGTHGLYDSSGYGGTYSYDGFIDSFLGCVY